MTGPRPVSPGRRLRWRAELLGWQALAAALAGIGHRRTLRFGEAVGGLIPRAVPRRLAVALADLRRIYGAGKAEAELAAIARSSLRVLGANLAELLWLARARDSAVEELVEIDEASRHALKEALARGRGAILVGIHFGRFELMFAGFRATGERFSLVVRELANPLLDAWLDRIRSRFGNRVLRQGRDARALHEAIARGELLLISLDHRDAGPRGAEVTFLGEPTRLATGIARLALRHDAALLPIHALPLPDGRLAIRLGPLLTPERSGDRRRDAQRLTQRLAELAGDAIRAHPEQWMWSHKHLWER